MVKTNYYSELKELEGKSFATLEEAEAAEAKVSEEIAAKQKVAEAKKTRADEVKSAIVARFAAEAEAKKAAAQAYSEYLAKVNAANATVTEAKDKENKLLSDFCKDYKYFHETIEYGDIKYDYSYNVPEKIDTIDFFKSFFGFHF